MGNPRPQTALPTSHPLMTAWLRYCATNDFANSVKWAAHEDHREGALWGAFMEGFRAATERAGNLFESIRPTSDDERLNKDPGAGAMGAVIEYRDAIRDALTPPPEAA